MREHFLETFQSDHHSNLSRRYFNLASQQDEDRNDVHQSPDAPMRLGSSSRLSTIQSLLGVRSPYISNPHSLETILPDFFSKERTIRVEAVRALETQGKQAPAQAARALVNALKDESSFVRAAATRALGSIGAEQYKSELIVQAQDQDWNVRAAAIEALSTLGEWAPREVLLQALCDVDETVRAVAAWSIIRLGAFAPIEPLILMLYDVDETVRAAAAGALGKLKDRAPIEPLVSALHDEDETVRAEAAGALGNLGGRAPIEPLVSALSDPDETVRAAAIWALGELGERTPIGPLVSALHDEDETVRTAIVSVLGGLGERTPIEVLILSLKDPSKTVQSEVSHAISKLGNPIFKGASTEFLLRAMGDESAQVRAIAVWALGERGDRAPVEPLINALKDESTLVRSAAAWALGELGDRAPVIPLAIASTEKHESVFAAAIQALAKLGNRASIEHLRFALCSFFQDKQGSVQLRCINDLDKKILVLYCTYLRREDSLQEAVLDTVGSYTPIEPLEDALSDANMVIRHVARQAQEMVNTQRWTEMFIVSLNLLEGPEKLSWQKDFPDQIVLCSISSSQEPGMAHLPLLDQIIDAWPKPWKEQICTHKEQLPDLKLWYGSAPGYKPANL